MIHTYKISGMSCGGCAHNVEEILSEIDGVVSANVDLVNQTASVETKNDSDVNISKYFENTKYTLMKV